MAAHVDAEASPTCEGGTRKRAHDSSEDEAVDGAAAVDEPECEVAAEGEDQPPPSKKRKQVVKISRRRRGP